VHFAALKAVGESAQKPLEYYENNIGGALSLFRCMAEVKCKRIVFSSSATVYGQTAGSDKLLETHPISATNPYGRTKVFLD
jgi:UDP-glucose 4-epimerase